MRQVPAMTFRTALKILGHHDHSLLGKIDNLLGGAILIAGAVALTGPAAAPVAAVAALWGWVDQKNEAVGLVRKFLTSMSERQLGLASYERTDLIAAAHTILVTCSVMEVFREELGRKVFKSLKLTKADEYELLVGDLGHRALDGLYESHVPFPSGGRGFLENRHDVHEWLEAVTNRLVDFYYGTKSLTRSLDRVELIARAKKRYESRYYELAAKVPEFAMWALLVRDEARQAELRELHHDVLVALHEQSAALSRFETLLTVLAGGASRAEPELAEIVRRSAIAELDEPIVPRGTAHFAHRREIEFPVVREIYIDPCYRWTQYGERARISDEYWWKDLPTFSDLGLRLAAYFASPNAVRLPLLVLGHPGAGKSLLTKVLAARLPQVTYTAVRVPLRHVPASAPIYLQVQEALNRATHGRVAWPTLTEQSAGTLRVILLDGLDELLQASEQSRSSFLDEVVEFQRTEAAQHRPVVVVVTSRTVVADRVSIPPDTTVIKLEDFDASQVDRWRRVWNRVNKPGIASGAVNPLSVEATSGSGELGRQPLLLLMVALYSADPMLPPIDSGLSPTTLYRRLLENFAWRENAKPPGRQTEELPEFVRKQLHQLAIAAFAMFNRGRQHVTDAELGDDLAALDATPPTSRRTEAARELTARFFFIHTAQSAVGHDQTYYSYEFLHATLGEYLIAREVVEALRDTAESATSRRGTQEPNDDLLFALLSHQCLATRRSILSFAADSLAALDDLERGHIRLVLDKLMTHCRNRHDSGRFNQYRPSPPDQIRAIATYSANLVLLKVLEARTGMALYEAWSANSESMWGSTLSLWQAGLDRNGWLAILTSIRRADSTIYFRDQPAALTLWNSELLHAKLRDDTQTSLFLEMGAAIRMNPAYELTAGFRTGTYHKGEAIEAAEELARWLFQALSMEIPKIDAEKLKGLLARPQAQRYPYHSTLINMLLKQRSDQLPYPIVRILVESLHSWNAEHHALMAATIAHPQLIKDLPGLADPERYARVPGIRLMVESSNNATRSVLAKFYNSIIERQGTKLMPMNEMAEDLLKAYKWPHRHQ